MRRLLARSAAPAAWHAPRRRTATITAAAPAGGGPGSGQLLRKELAAAIAVGAPLFNAGRPNDCYLIYRGAAQRLAGTAAAEAPAEAALLRCDPSAAWQRHRQRRALCGVAALGRAAVRDVPLAWPPPPFAQERPGRSRGRAGRTHGCVGPPARV
jgi:hypothetical protein